MPRLGRNQRQGMRRSLGYPMESGDFPVPVLRLKFGENAGTVAGDSSPSELDGTIEGAAWAKGYLGPGLDLDGEDDYVEVGDDPQISGLAALTLSIWVKFDDVSDSESSDATYISGIVIKSRAPADSWAFAEWELYMDRRSAQMYLAFVVMSDSSGRYVTYSLTGLEAGVWYHLVGTWSPGDDIAFYVDGEAVGTTGGTAISSMNDVDASIFVGGADWRDRQLAAVVDEFQMWEEALSAARVRELYQGFR